VTVEAVRAARRGVVVSGVASGERGVAADEAGVGASAAPRLPSGEARLCRQRSFSTLKASAVSVR